MARFGGLKAASWLAMLVAAGLPQPAFGADGTGVCHRFLECRNYSGPVTGKEADGAFVSAVERRVTIFKLSPETVMVVTLAVFGDGGRTLNTETWDFIEDDGKISREGKFAVYSDVPDITGSNKIGTGRCANGTCTYRIALPKDERTVTGTMRFDGGAIALDETEVTTYQDKRGTTFYKGRLTADEM